jgi:hypothetical protein
MGQLIRGIGEVSDDLTVYVREEQVGRSPETAVLLLDDDKQVPDGAVYLLEVDIIKEVISVWSDWRNGAEPSVSQACEAVFYYAAHDAYQPPGE